jgi:antibiotic biosynthesis monooxygenase (ABM) superfamily enzyme
MSGVVYEVNLHVRRAIERDYRAWLDAHMREILALPGFVRAELFEVVDPAPNAEEFALCTRYHLRDAAALENYFREHAPRLRAEGLARFGGNFRAERRVLTPIP